ncbi:hypothetical protein [Yersinia sp. Marseille-Q3913]|uniref:hypothetical protein n=1 Tax=Yersinia sp. Marseille-Q3913 TaxID=2830769 RepID=UPI001BB029A6|nr:hypothetical protein [Yersinia sp. Marseille-Q3913]MBS0057242.1 hypothetical protein [Yersinia sp. Marseille-Q3913]
MDNGIVTGAADIPALEQEFGEMMKLEKWLTGPGKRLFEAALNAPLADIQLR